MFVNRSPYNKTLQEMNFYDKFVERFQVISKVKNPAVSVAIIAAPDLAITQSLQKKLSH